jgi:hypothetical protein
MTRFNTTSSQDGSADICQIRQTNSENSAPEAAEASLIWTTKMHVTEGGGKQEDDGYVFWWQQQLLQ